MYVSTYIASELLIATLNGICMYVHTYNVKQIRQKDRLKNVSVYFFKIV